MTDLSFLVLLIDVVVVTNYVMSRRSKHDEWDPMRELSAASHLLFLIYFSIVLLCMISAPNLLFEILRKIAG